MNSYLGIYVENKLIKYSKVSADKNKNYKIETYGVKFSEDIAPSISQIINETFSFNIPIILNTSNELYNNYNVFSKLDRTDIKNALELEFEEYCTDKSLNSKLYIKKYILSKGLTSDTFKALHIAVPKSEVTRKLGFYNKNKISNISPISISLTNLISSTDKDYIIVNIEEKTNITVVQNGEIVKVVPISIGMENIFNKLIIKTGTYQKAYEVCKSYTLYTDTNRELAPNDINSVEYGDYIEPTIQDIMSRISNAIQEFKPGISKIYISGTGVILNNIDLYFNEYFGIKSVLLTPNFLNIAVSNIKDYIEINSATSLALEGFKGNKSQTNFYVHSSNEIFIEKISQILGLLNKSTGKNNIDKANIQNGFDLVEKLLLRINLVIISAIITYASIGFVISNSYNAQRSSIQEMTGKILSENQKITNDTEFVKAETKKIQSINTSITALNQIVNEKSVNGLLTYDVAKFLERFMYIVPEGVQITKITKNDVANAKLVTIDAQSDQYKYLAYLISKIKLENFLKNFKYDIIDQGASGKIKIKLSGEI